MSAPVSDAARQLCEQMPWIKCAGEVCERCRVIQAALSAAEAKGRSDRDAEWREALFPGNADTDLGEMGSKPETAARIIAEAKAIAEDEGREKGIQATLKLHSEAVQQGRADMAREIAEEMLAEALKNRSPHGEWLLRDGRLLHDWATRIEAKR